MEIYIKKEKTNRFVMTLKESGSLANPNYLLIFKNTYNTNSVEIPFTTTDLSPAKDRYNLFELVETSSGSTTGGTAVPLSLMTGQYEYTAYESTGSTLSISATTGVILETGRMVVDDESGVLFTNEVIPAQNNNNPSIYD